MVVLLLLLRARLPDFDAPLRWTVRVLCW
jgi:hypothetical protein